MLISVVQQSVIHIYTFSYSFPLCLSQDTDYSSLCSTLCCSLSHVHSLWPRGLQHARLLCPSPSSGACSNSCTLSRWCHPTISSSVVPFSSCLQSFPASGSFQMSQLFAWGGQSIGVSASASVLPNEYSGLISFRTDWLDLLAVQRTLKSLLQHHGSKHQFLGTQTSFWTHTSIHDCWKNHSFD